LNVLPINRIDLHPPESDQDSSLESISDNEHCLNWNADFDNPTGNQDDWDPDNESDIELDNGSEKSGSQKLQNVNALLNVPGVLSLNYYQRRRLKRHSGRTI
jgi:hypothetical protein